MVSVINIAEDYTPFLGGRYVEDGEGNGTTFRRSLLVPALREGTGSVRIILDGAAGYPSSFLEEAFGGLVRVEGFTFAELQGRIEFVAEQPGFKRYISQVWEFIKNAKPAGRN